MMRVCLLIAALALVGCDQPLPGVPDVASVSGDAKVAEPASKDALIEPPSIDPAPPSIPNADLQPIPAAGSDTAGAPATPQLSLPEAPPALGIGSAPGTIDSAPPAPGANPLEVPSVPAPSPANPEPFTPLAPDGVIPPARIPAPGGEPAAPPSPATLVPINPTAPDGANLSGPTLPPGGEPGAPPSPATLDPVISTPAVPNNPNVEPAAPGGGNPFGGFFGGGGPTPAGGNPYFYFGGQNANPARYVASNAIIVTWSEKHDAVWGFSKTTGTWTKQELNPAATEPPNVGGSLATIRGGSTVYAYSGQTGRWDALPLPADHQPQVALQENFVLVTDGDNVYTFADATGRWTSPGGELEPAERTLKVFRLRFVQAADLARTITQLLGPVQASVSVDERTNSLLVAAAGDVHKKIEALVQKMDTQSGASRLPGTTSAATSDLRRKYQGLDREAEKLAEQSRAEAEFKGPSHPDRVRVQQSLAAAVRAAFQARQELHRAELAEFQGRMADLQQAIEDRQRLEDEIVARRVAELLDPGLSWYEPAEAASNAPAGEAPAKTPSNRPAPQSTGNTAAPPTAQVVFASPTGARYTLSNSLDQAHVAPFGQTVPCGETVSFALSAIPNHPGLELSGSVETAPIDVAIRNFVSHNSIPVTITDEDLDQAISGNLVTKVIYSPTAKFGELANAGVEAISSTRLDPGADPVAEAAKRGDVLATLRLGNRVDFKGGAAASAALPGVPVEPSQLPAVPSGEQQAGHVGVVADASDPKRVEVSCAEVGGIRAGEVLEILRQNAEYGPLDRVGRIEIFAADAESALGRVLETRRILASNRYVYDTVQQGDRVERAARTHAAKPSPSDAAAKATSKENLKALMLALHNYHDTHTHFPPAVILGKDGKGGPPHSWRVELLPFLNEQALYNDYGFDEPWDSEQNKALLAKMPAVFRSPLDAPDSTNASYFGIVLAGGQADAAALQPAGAASTFEPAGSADAGGGAGPAATARIYPLIGAATLGVAVDPNSTFFSRPQGARLPEISDGTSNAIGLVEAKRNIPWTRPHDIAYVPDQSLPVLGGWFPAGWHAAFADGTVKFIAADNHESIIRALFTIGGGENVVPNLVPEE